MSWKDNINTIKEVYPGQFHLLLDFATTAFLPYLIRDEYRYVWVRNHWVSQSQVDDFYTWANYSLPLFDPQINYSVLARQIKFDFVLPTQEFKRLLPHIKHGVMLTQLNTLPNYYLDDRIKGKTRYTLLSKECDYLFEVDIRSPTDYSSLMSPHRSYLEALLADKSIDWNDLP